MAKKKSPSSNPEASSSASPTRARRAPRRKTSSEDRTDRTTSSEPAATAADRPAELSDLSIAQAPSYEAIAEAAYHRFLQRGGTDGRDFDDWIEAEQELRRANRL
jgi:hypothetical protein